MQNNEEKEIVKRVLSGSVDEFGELVERYHKGLCIYLVNMVHDEALAEDIAQDAFIRAYERLETYNDTYSFSTWLYKIARNLALRSLDNLNRSSSYDEGQIEPIEAKSAEESIQEEERLDSVQNAISTLKPEYQEVINLYYWSGKSYEEISQILDCPINTVRTWLHRSKESIRKELYGQVG